MNSEAIARWNADHPTDIFPAFAWPGGYPIIYILADGETLCAECARGENGSQATLDKDESPDWRIEGADIYYEGPPVACANCCTEIESAYGDPDDPDNQDTPREAGNAAAALERIRNLYPEIENLPEFDIVRSVVERGVRVEPLLAPRCPVCHGAGSVPSIGPEDKQDNGSVPCPLCGDDGSSWDMSEEMAPPPKPAVRVVSVLCGCGWGHLGMLESEVPDRCPVCNNPIPGKGDE